MREYWSEFWPLLVAPAGVILAVAWLARSIVTYFLSKDIDKFKNRLELVSKERETTYTILQTKRADVIEKLYGKLIDYLAASEKYLSPFGFEGDPPEDEQLRAVGKAQVEFFSYFYRNKIYFSESVCAGIENLSKTIAPSVRKYAHWMQFSERYPEHHKDRLDAAKEAVDTMEKKVPPIMAAIESDFRGLLGVENGGKSA